MRTDIAYVRSLEARLEELRTAADLADAEYREEIARLRITDEEREAVEWFARHSNHGMSMRRSAMLRSLLERLGK